MGDYYQGNVCFPVQMLDRTNTEGETLRQRLDAVKKDFDFGPFESFDIRDKFVEISGQWHDGEHENLMELLEAHRVPYDASWEGFYEIDGGVKWYRPGIDSCEDLRGEAAKNGCGEYFITTSEVQEMKSLTPVDFMEKVIGKLEDPIPPFFPVDSDGVVDETPLEIHTHLYVCMDRTIIDPHELLKEVSLRYRAIRILESNGLYYDVDQYGGSVDYKFFGPIGSMVTGMQELVAAGLDGFNVECYSKADFDAIEAAGLCESFMVNTYFNDAACAAQEGLNMNAVKDTVGFITRYDSGSQRTTLAPADESIAILTHYCGISEIEHIDVFVTQELSAERRAKIDTLSENHKFGIVQVLSVAEFVEKFHDMPGISVFGETVASKFKA